jgi:hypothetical protein
MFLFVLIVTDRLFCFGGGLAAAAANKRKTNKNINQH